MNYEFNEGILILAIRRLYGYSQIEFCEFLGYSQSTISKIENQILTPDINFVVAMARKLNVDMNIFKLGFIPKIPTYLLQNKKNSFLSHPYLRDGFFPSKTTFFFLELITRNFKIDAFNAIGIPREYFVFSELRFNLELFSNIVQYVNSSDIIDALERERAKASPTIAEDQFKECLVDLQMVSINNILYHDGHCDVSLELDSSRRDTLELSSYFQHIVAFHLLKTMNLSVKVVRSKKHSSDFILRLYAS